MKCNILGPSVFLPIIKFTRVRLMNTQPMALFKIPLISLLLTITCLSLAGQDSLTTSFRRARMEKKLWITGAAHVGLYTGSLLVLNEAWYKGYPKQSLASFNDSHEWLQTDKFGHAWTAYNLGRASSAAWQWAGLNKRQSAIAGASAGFAFLTVIEFLDGRSSNWGWSWSDIAANSFGTGLYLGQELAWGEQRIRYKFSFHGKSYIDPMLENRSDKLFGKSWYERMLKDYNGQTYWLSVNIKSFTPQSKWPAWLNVALGYGADGMFGGFDNTGRDENGNVIFDRRDIARVRQFYLSPDIDWMKIKTSRKWLKTAFYILNSFKFPAPSLMINSRGNIRFQPFYF